MAGRKKAKRASKKKAHPGFNSVANKIAKEKGKNGKPIGKKAADAILASRTRGASKAAKKANPRLKRVSG